MTTLQRTSTPRQTTTRRKPVATATRLHDGTPSVTTTSTRRRKPAATSRRRISEAERRAELEELAQWDADEQAAQVAILEGRASICPDWMLEGLTMRERKALNRGGCKGLSVNAALTLVLSRRPPAGGALDWPSWTDGEIWELVDGIDFLPVDSWDVGRVATQILGLDFDEAVRRLARPAAFDPSPEDRSWWAQARDAEARVDDAPVRGGSPDERPVRVRGVRSRVQPDYSDHDHQAAGHAV